MGGTGSYQGLLLQLLSYVLFSFAVVAGSGSGSGILRVNFYDSTCPRAEEIVRDVITEKFLSSPRDAAGLLRLFFHDCFVQGCDASILLDATPSGGSTEKESPANNNTLRGLDAIDEAKRRIEEECQGVVSCADILTFAARDASVLSGLQFYDVYSGRRDGRTSLSSNVIGNLPPPFATVDSQAEIFAKRGFSLEEMVVLLGAHSIGKAHCSSFDQRLYGNGPPSPGINPLYTTYLKLRCPRQGSFLSRLVDRGAIMVDLTPASGFILGNSYYHALLRGEGLLSSDQALASDDRTRGIVKYMAMKPSEWAGKFVLAMQKLGTVDVLVGNDQGEIRRSCRQVN